MALKLVYDKIDEIEEPFRGLYTEKAGKFEFSGVEGIRTDLDVQRLQTSLNAEREAHKGTKTKYSAWDGLGKTHEEVATILQKYPELEAAAAGKIDEKKLEEMVNSRLPSKLGPLQRELETIKAERDTLKNENEQFKTKERRGSIFEKIRGAASELKVLDTAVEDILEAHGERVFEINDIGDVVTKSNLNGVTPGISPKAWLMDMQSKKPHWWPPSQGGGAGGGQGGGQGGQKNPWSHEHWNMTAQVGIIRQNKALAEQLAAAAGTKIGGGKPPAPKK